MTLSSPLLLVIGLLVTAALIAAAVTVSRRRKAALIAAGVAIPGKRRGGLGFGTGLTIAGVAVLAVAAAGPVAMVPVPRASGTVMLAVDVSNSMAAEDVRPNRLAAAQQAARAFVQAQPETVDIGLVAFEQGALVTARPDRDHSVALRAIDRLRITGGTSLSAAILASLSAITGRQVAIGPGGSVPDIGYWPSATIVIFSDGETQGDENVEQAAQVAQRAGVRIHAVGIGTTAGATVSVDGYRVQTALDEQTLTMIARTTGGAYHPAGDAAQLAGIADTIDLRLTVSDEPLPLAGAFIAFALVLLTGGAVLTVFRTGRVI